MTKVFGREHNPPAHLICAVDRPSPAARERLLAKARSFMDHHPERRVVSFLDDLDGAEIGVDRKVDSWRSALGIEVYNSTWQQSYRVADAFLGTLDGNLRELLQPYYHTIADKAHQLLQLDVLLADPAQPTMVIFPSRSTAQFAGMSATVWRVSSIGERLRIFWRRAQFVTQAVTSKLRRELSSNAPATDDSGAVASNKAQPHDASVAANAHIAIAVQEGVAAINSPSALAVAEQLARLGRVSVIVTPNRTIQALASSKGIPCLCPVELSPTVLRPKWLSFAWSCFETLSAIERNERASHDTRRVARSLRSELPLWLVLHATTVAMLDAYHRDVHPIGAGLLINEGTPVSGLVLSWLKAKGLADCGYWPALLGDRPDCDYFPATQHLVYGHQLRTHMLELGIDAESITSVGSVNYDVSLGRDKDQDIDKVRASILPEWDGKAPLVVVATEALPRPEEELLPVLNSLVHLGTPHIVLKLHPADSPDYFRRMLEHADLTNRVRLVDRCDLDALLHAASLLICVLSNIIINAALLGTPTLVCDFSNKRRPLDFVRLGLAVGCFSPAELLQTIGALLGAGELRQTALKLLPQGMKEFNYPSDGYSAGRVARLLDGLADGAGKGSGSS